MPKMLVLDFDLTLVYPHTYRILLGIYGTRLKEIQQKYGHPGSDAWKASREFAALQQDIYAEVKARLNGGIFNLINPKQIKELIEAAQKQGTVVAVASFTQFPGAIQAVLEHLGLNAAQRSKIEIECDLPPPDERLRSGKVPHIQRLIDRLSKQGTGITEVGLLDDEYNNILTAQAAKGEELPQKTTAIHVPVPKELYTSDAPPTAELASPLPIEYITDIAVALGLTLPTASMHAPGPLLLTPIPTIAGQTSASAGDAATAQIINMLNNSTPTYWWAPSSVDGKLTIAKKDNLSLTKDGANDLLAKIIGLNPYLEDHLEVRPTIRPGGGYTIRADVNGIHKEIVNIINMLNTMTNKENYIWAPSSVEGHLTIAKEGGSSLTKSEAEEILANIIAQNKYLAAHLQVGTTTRLPGGYTIRADLKEIYKLIKKSKFPPTVRKARS